MDYTTLSLADVKTALDAVARETEATFGTLNARQLNWRPDAARWSVGQCFEHLLTANRLMLGAAEDALNPARPRSVWQRLPGVPGVIGRLMVRSQAPEATRKFKAPTPAQPTTSDVADDVDSALRRTAPRCRSAGGGARRPARGPDDHDVTVRAGHHLQRAGRLAPDGGARPAAFRAGPPGHGDGGVSEVAARRSDVRRPPG